MKKTEQIGNIKIIIDDSYCHNENIDDIVGYIHSSEMFKRMWKIGKYS